MFKATSTKFMIESHFVIEDRKTLSSNRKRNKIVTNRINNKNRSRYHAYNLLLLSSHRFLLVLIAIESLSSTYSQSTSSSLSRRHHQNKSTSNHNILIKFRSNVCKNSTNAFAKIIDSTHDRESVFVISSLHWRHLSFCQSSTHCFSRSRTLLFCFSSNFSDFNETQTKSKKFSLRNLTRLRKAFHIDHALFCSVFFHWVFQILMRHRQRTKNRLFYLSIDRACYQCFDHHSIDRRRHETN